MVRHAFEEFVTSTLHQFSICSMTKLRAPILMRQKTWAAKYYFESNLAADSKNCINPDATSILLISCDSLFG